MTFLEALILWSLEKLRGERTIYSVFHLLKGKKSSQTIQDAYLYKVEVLFYTFPNMTREYFDETIRSLINRSFLTVESNYSYCLSNEGEKIVHEYFQEHRFPEYLNGMKYQEQTFLFWKRLIILIQVLSNLINENRRYYPILRDPDLLKWIKGFIRSKRMLKDHLSTALYGELSTILSNNPPDEPNLLVMRLTGFNQIGKTIEQAARRFGLENTNYWYRYLNLPHFVMGEVLEKKKNFPLLNSLFQDMYKPFPLTKSTLETYELLTKNFSIIDISKIRKLKESTIQDHIIEIALHNPSFSIEKFMDKNTEVKIVKIAKRLGMQRLKPIKDQVENVTYFQIRLALAKNR